VDIAENSNSPRSTAALDALVFVLLLRHPCSFPTAVKVHQRRTVERQAGANKKLERVGELYRCLDFNGRYCTITFTPCALNCGSSMFRSVHGRPTYTSSVPWSARAITPCKVTPEQSLKSRRVKWRQWSQRSHAAITHPGFIQRHFLQQRAAFRQLHHGPIRYEQTTKVCRLQLWAVPCRGEYYFVAHLVTATELNTP
jgi:hypothetical protein